MEGYSSKHQEFVKTLEQMIQNLEKKENLSNDEIKGLFKTFLMVQIENTKFIGEISDSINKHREELDYLRGRISSKT